MKFSKSLPMFLLVASIALTTTSCGVKIPADVKTTIGSLGNDLPVFMGKATGQLTPELQTEGDNILAAINAAVAATKGGKTASLSSLLNTLGAGKFKPFMTMWKKKGKLDQKTVDAQTKGVMAAFEAVRKKAKVK